MHGMIISIGSNKIKKLLLK